MEYAPRNNPKVPIIDIITPKTAREFEPDPNDLLVGDGLISCGNIVTIGGEPGCGKSRLLTTLAVAGARGTNRWQNYPLRCQFRTLILQTENTGERLKEEFSAVPPEYDDFIRVSRSMANGMAFDSIEFRRELRRFFDAWPFQVMGIDPWNDVSFDEGQKDFKQALLNIRNVFHGEKCPAIIIVAHLRKRGRDEGQRRKTGRELMHELSGSLALGSESRTIFAVQPATPNMSDDRIVFEIAKANNCHPDWLKEHGTRSAWHRRDGAFVAVEKFDWNEWENPGDTDRRKITDDQIRQIFDGEPELKAAGIAKKAKTMFGIGESTVFRAIGEDGYLRSLLTRTGTGKLKLKD
jgi:hypothetical protein